MYTVTRVIGYRFYGKTQQQLFLTLNGRHICAPRRGTNMAPPYKALSIWLKSFSKYFMYEKLHRSKSLQGFLHVRNLSNARFLSSSIECFRFYYLSRAMCKPPIGTCILQQRTVTQHCSVTQHTPRLDR